MNVEGRKCREHIFETRMTKGITMKYFSIKRSVIDKQSTLTPLILFQIFNFNNHDKRV